MNQLRGWFFVDLVTETIKSEKSSSKKTEVNIDILADYLHMKSYFWDRKSVV